MDINIMYDTLAGEELKRLQGKQSLRNDSGTIATLAIHCLSNGNAECVNERVVQALVAVLSNVREPWPTYVQWLRILPRWLVDACEPERTEEEAREWLLRWRGADEAERAVMKKDRGWTLTGWVYWFRPENRTWRWRSGRVVDPNNYIVEVEMLTVPLALEPLDWLLMVSSVSEAHDDLSVT